MTNTRHTVSRRKAAEITGLAVGTLRNWACSDPQRGPLCIKTGTTPQARTLYPLDEIHQWQTDPAGYERRRRGGKRHDDRRKGN